MATSRIGGTSGKLKGQVGNVIYQVKKNPDGTYTQYVYNKGVRTEETITPKLQAQRMCVAIVESLMADLKPVGRISFQSGQNKTQSLNGFSANNIRLVQRDCKDHWYSGNEFIFPRRYNSEKDVQDLGGPFIISSGTLSYNTYDQLLWDYVPEIRFRDVPQSAGWLYGLLFQCRFGVETVEEFLDNHHMTRSDKVVFCGFREWLDYTQDPDDPKAYSKHDYIIVSINPRIDGSTLMTPEVLSQLFTFESKLFVNFYMTRANDAFVIGTITDYYNADEQFYYVAGFSISYPRGRKQISTSFYHNPDGDTEPWLRDQQPANVFGSWMGEPGVVPYPSPF